LTFYFIVTLSEKFGPFYSIASASASDSKGGWLGGWFSSSKPVETTSVPESDSKESEKQKLKTLR